MGVRVVRTVTRFPASPDTDAEKPGLDVAARPDASSCVFSFALYRIKFSFRILRPVDCETVAHQPFAEIDVTHRTSRHRAPVLIQRDRDATHRPPRNERVKVVRRLGPA